MQIGIQRDQVTPFVAGNTKKKKEKKLDSLILFWIYCHLSDLKI